MVSFQTIVHQHNPAVGRSNGLDDVHAGQSAQIIWRHLPWASFLTKWGNPLEYELTPVELTDSMDWGWPNLDQNLRHKMSASKFGTFRPKNWIRSSCRNKREHFPFPNLQSIDNGVSAVRQSAQKVTSALQRHSPFKAVHMETTQVFSPTSIVIG